MPGGCPRLEIDLDKIQHNAAMLVESLGARGISITAVTKSISGMPEVSAAFLRAGITRLGDSRIENIERLQSASLPAPMLLIRSPMLSQVSRVVQHTDISFNTELTVIAGLSAAAQKAGKIHGIVLMVELGDLREGIMPDDMEAFVREVLTFPAILLKGIGANLACRSGVEPDSSNMDQLSGLANSLEATFGLSFDIVSGGNSANLDWALGRMNPGQINNLRLGESLLLGTEALHSHPIAGLYTDAITLVAEVIESKLKPSQPWGRLAQNAFGEKPVYTDRGHIRQAILAVGRQDIDPQGLIPPQGIKIISASSDHLIVESVAADLVVGTELTFQINYSALMRAMTSPFVTKMIIESPCDHKQLLCSS